MNKIFSIIIPTRNRQVYCLESVISILKELDTNCELIVQDNSSDNSLQKQIENLNDDRIVYNYNPVQLSFIDNFEEALNLSSTRYFCVLGDDDSITKDILIIVQWMEVNEIESLASTRVIDYVWPNDTIEKYKEGMLSIPIYNGAIEFVNVEDNLKELVKGGFLSYQNYNLPRTYHGIIRRSSMDEVKTISGRYFGGLTPDIYSTVALAGIIKKHVVIDYPFSIAGACPVSATVHATVGGHSGKLEEAPHFRNRDKYDWENVIPSYYSVETIWAETAIKALKDIGREDLLLFFNNYRLYVYGIYINKKYILKLTITKTLVLYKNLGVNPLVHVLNIGKEVIKIAYTVFNKNIILSKTIQYEPIILKKVVTLEDAKTKIYKNLIKLNLPENV